MHSKQETAPEGRRPRGPLANAKTQRAQSLRLIADLCRGNELPVLQRDFAPDWRSLWAVACEQRMGNLLAGKLLSQPGVIGGELALVIRGFMRSDVQLSLALAAETLRIVAKLESGGVPAALFKGSLLAIAAHGSLSMRQAGDIDVFVHKKDCERAIAILGECGYQMDPSWGPSGLIARLSFNCECELINPPRRMCIDLHWEFTARNASLSLPVHELMSRLTEVEFCGRKVLTFCPEDQVLVLSLHGAKHHWQRMEWVFTIGQFIRRHPGLDWPMILARAEEMGLAHLVGTGLLLADHLFSAHLPAEVLKSARTDRVALDLAERSLRWIVDGPEKPPSAFELLCFSAASRGTLGRKLRYWLGVVAIPSLRDYGAPAPARFPALYYPLRASRLLCASPGKIWRLLGRFFARQTSKASQPVTQSSR